ncbi:MAG: ABC transporter ATP-binding protein [Proteobacteria bacterium]|nr:ABC transporter ATP-binding protein [Pseudomonadota bacterium]MBU1451418.1 ABC transporter ATP-binding protein [Pseudomonadota bacterium]MBU2468093.1 ABC transporter ATP-binding protein [Pseudomonadota bacterium]MBU2516337.1 ABC transporter ATP-binding protein [Pseudomonadota bacterium]
MLSVQGLSKSFGPFLAVADANLEVARGEVVAVIGPNGAGKTTLFKLITGQLKPDGGRVLFKGQDIAGLSPHRVCRLGLSLSYQVVNIFSRMSVFENVQVAVLARRRQVLRLFTPAAHLAVDETWEILNSVGLAEKAAVTSGTLSHGDSKVLEMAIALGNRPELLIMDEPTAGMSPEETRAAMALIRRLNTEMGLTILFCEHDMELVFNLAQRIMVMRQGRTIAQGTCDEVRCDEKVQQAYLGGHDHA